VRFRVLGSLEVRRGAATVTIASHRQRTVLAALLLHPGAVVSVDALADALWGDRPPRDPRNAVQTYVARLREALGEGAGLLTRSPGYVLDVPPAQLDALRFEQLLGEAHQRRSEPAAARALLDEALALWRGPAYAEFADGVARAEALRLEERRLGALEARAGARLALGEASEVVAELEALAVEHPLRERVTELRMHALAAVDRQAEALEVFRTYRARLADEAGLEPGRALRDLEGAILRGEPGGSGPDDMPTAGAPAAPGGAVPLMPTSLVGRDEDIAALRAVLSRQRLVTLTGPGGVGKTRIAAAVAAAEGRTADREVAWVELAAVSDPGAVAHVVAAALGIDLAGGQPAQDNLLTAIGRRALLLALDNCEHLVDTVAPLVDHLQRRCPNVRVLVTSRERLAVDGEHVRQVPPLPVEPPDGDGAAPAAVQLFCDRAAAVRHGGAPDARELALVADICRQLDGLPLAIELAAARTGALSLGDLRAALGDDVAAAVGHRRGRPERQRDLWNVVEWSYRLLPAAEQQLFARLGVFAGAFGVDEAHAVCAPMAQSRGETLEQLVALAERSLLVGPRDDDGRYRLLRPLRAFARQGLADRDELDVLADRHARVLTERAERAAGPPLTGTGTRWLSGTLDDLRAIRRRACRTGDVALLGRLVALLYRFDYWRPGAELLGWADDALALSGIDEEPTAPQVHAAAATAAWMRGEHERARRLAARATQLGAGPDDTARAYAFEAVGDTAFFEGRLADSEAAFREGARLGRRSGDPDTELNSRAGVAMALAYMDRIEEAIDELDAAERAAPDAGPAVRAFARYARGECLAEVAPDEAVALVEEAVALARSSDAWFVEGVALLTAASLRGRHSAPEEAAPAFADLLRHWRRSGNWAQQWTTLRNVAELLVRLGAEEAAVTIAAAADAHDSATPTFGPESDRLGQALAAARTRLGSARWEAARRRGERLTGEAVVELAHQALAAPAAHRPAAGRA
jgi:predicted ATPase/DNA-binding SARP family transcriptional activator